jgi:hypothetical protein
MSSDAPDDQIPKDRLLEYLDDTEAVQSTLESVPVNAFNPARRDGLRELYIKYCSAGGDPDRRSNGHARNGRVSKQNKKPTPEVTRFKNIGTLVVPSQIATYMKRWGTDPRHFMDGKVLVYGVTEPGDNVGDAFIRHYRYTTDVLGDLRSRHMQYLFLMLSYHDIGNLIMTTRGMGHRQLIAIQQFLENIQFEGTKITPAAAASQFMDWWTLGTKLDVLCQEFGAGCLIILADELSENFIRTKFRLSGPHHAEVMGHLRDRLRLGLFLAQSGVGELGENIRNLLKAPYVAEVARQSAGRIQV